MLPVFKSHFTPGVQGPAWGTASTMVRCLLLFCLVAVIYPANSLKCLSCSGTDTECEPTEVTCPGSGDKCGTSTMTINSFPCKSRMVFKGCVKNSTEPSRNISISPSTIVRFSLREETCNTNLCNEKTLTDSLGQQNNLYCHSCISPGKDCSSENTSTMKCTGGQTQCLDVKVVGSFGDIGDINFKGCGDVTSCSEDLIFSSETSSVSMKCCDSNFCNSIGVAHSIDMSPNGVECYSCNTFDGRKCSPEEVTKSQCYGPLTNCLEVAGMTVEDGKRKPSVIKGCATPKMCETSFIPLLQKLVNSRVECCNGSLCNTKFTVENLNASGYFPTESSPSGTGSQRYPRDQGMANGIKRPPYYANPVKNGQDTNNYGSANTGESSSTYDTDSDGIKGYGLLNDPSVFTMTNNGPQNNYNYNNGDTDSNGGAPELGGSISDSANNPTNITQDTEEDGQYSVVYTNSNMVDSGDSYWAGNDDDLLQQYDDDTWDINANGDPNWTSSSYDIGNASSGPIDNPAPTSSDEFNSTETYSTDNLNGTSETISLTVYDESILLNSVYNNASSDEEATSDNSSEYGSNVFNTSSKPPGHLNVYGSSSTSAGDVTQGKINNTSPGSYITGGVGNIQGNNTSSISYTGVGEGTLPTAGWSNNNGSSQNTMHSEGNSYATGSGYTQDVNHTGSNSHTSVGHNTGSNVNGSGYGVVGSDSTSYISNPGSNSSGGLLYDVPYNHNNGGDYNSGQMPPEGSSPGYESGTYGPYGEGGNDNGNYLVAPGESSSEASNTNTNNFVYVPNIPLPGSNGTNGTYSNLILLLSNSTGINPALLAEKLNGSTVTNPKTLISALSGIDGFDPRKLSPDLQAFIFGYSSQPSHSYPSDTGVSFSKLPPGWNISDIGNKSNLISLLSNITGISPVVLSQKLNGSSIANYSNLVSELSRIPGIDLNNLPPELKAYMLGNNTNPDYLYQGISNGTSHMAPGEISNEPSHVNTNNLGSSYGNNYGYDSNIPVPGANGMNTTYSNLIHMLSNATGISPALLSQKLNESTVGNPNILISTLSSIEGFDPRKMSPDLKAFIFGNSSQPSHTNPIDTGFDVHELPAGWDISNASTNSDLVTLLCNITGISPVLVSKKLNGSSMANLSSIANDVSKIPGFDFNNFPPELKEYISSNNSNAVQTYLNQGNNSVGGFVYNSDQIPPDTTRGQQLWRMLWSRWQLWQILQRWKHQWQQSYGSSNGQSYTNINNLGSSYGNNHSYGSNIPVPGANGMNTTYSNLIRILSNATGMSPALLSQKLNESTVANPNILISTLSSIEGFDPRKLSPDLKAFIFGNSSQPSHTYPTHTGLNLNKLPPGLNFSDVSKNSVLVIMLSNITGISPALLSQKLNGSNIANHSNLAKELSSILGPDLNRLPPELKEYILGNNSNHAYSGNGTSNIGGPPKDHNHANSFGHDGSYGHNETSYANSNHLDSSYGNTSNLINVLSSITGVSPALLSQKLNGTDIANHTNLINILSTIPGFDPKMLPPYMHNYIYGNSNDLGDPYSSDTGPSHNMPPPNWHGAGYGNAINTDTFDGNLWLPGRSSNESAAGNNTGKDTENNSAYSIGKRAGVLAIAFTMSVLVLT